MGTRGCHIDFALWASALGDRLHQRRQVRCPPEPLEEEAAAKLSADEANAGTLELTPEPLQAPHVT